MISMVYIVQTGEIRRGAKTYILIRPLLLFRSIVVSSALRLYTIFISRNWAGFAEQCKQWWFRVFKCLTANAMLAIHNPHYLKLSRGQSGEEKEWVRDNLR